MGKKFFNKHKRSRSVFESHLHSIRHPRNIGKKIQKQAIPMAKALGVNSRQGAGSKLELAGQIITAVGVVSGQPEIAAAGVGVSVIGEVVKPRKQGENIGGSIGGAIAGPLGARILGAGGEECDEENAKEESSKDRTHHGQIKEQIKEHQHFNDKEQHHNQVQLPNELQGTNQVASGVGSSLSTNPADVVSKADDFEEDIEMFKNGTEVLEFMTNNFNTFEHLTQSEKDEILGDILGTKLLDETLDGLITAGF